MIKTNFTKSDVEDYISFALSQNKGSIVKVNYSYEYGIATALITPADLVLKEDYLCKNGNDILIVYSNIRSLNII